MHQPKPEPAPEPQAPPTASPALDRRIQTICLFALTLIAIAVALYWLRPVLIPFVLAIFFAYTLMPLVDLLTDRARLPRAFAIPVTLLIGISGFVAIAALVTSSVRQLARNAGTYQERFADAVTQASSFLDRHGLEFGADAVQRYLASFPIGETVATVANTLLDTVSNTFLVLLFGLYLLFGYRRATVGSLRDQIESGIKKYIVTKFAVSAATGVFVGMILWLLEVDLALVFGVLAFLLNFIPSIGSIIATLLPLPVLLMSDASTTTLVLALALPGAIQTLIGNVLEPKIMGDALQLHPITILMALILWGVIWGIPGMFLATPITAVLKILFETLDLTRPLAHLMSGHIDGADAG